MFEKILSDTKKLITSGIESGRYSQSTKQSWYFPDFELKYTYGFIESMPLKRQPVKALFWAHGTIHNICSDLKQTYAEDSKEHQFIKNNGAFLRDLITALLNNDTQACEGLKDAYIRKEEGSQLFYKSETPIRAIGIEEPTFTFSIEDAIKITLRQPTLDDIIEVFENNRGQFYFVTETDLPSIIAEVKMPIIDSSSVGELQKETSILHYILHLYGVGSITSDVTTYKSEDFGKFHNSKHGRAEKKGYFSYCITSERFSHFRAQYPALRKAIIECGWVDGDLNASQVAYERYRDALCESPYTFQQQVSLIVMGLESILTAKGGELSYSLRMRGAMLSKILWNESLSEYLKIAYAIRSDYAHGNIKRDKLTKKVLTIEKERSQFSGKLLNLLRASILLSLFSTYDKKRGHVEALQKIIDDIMLLDKNALKKLTDIFTRHQDMF